MHYKEGNGRWQIAKDHILGSTSIELVKGGDVGLYGSEEDWEFRIEAHNAYSGMEADYHENISASLEGIISQPSTPHFILDLPREIFALPISDVRLNIAAESTPPSSFQW